MSASKSAGQGPKVGGRRTASAGVVGRRGWRELDRRLLAVLGRLTDRDRLLCRLLDDHRVLTSAQVADVAFSGERRARMRLAELYAMDVLDRFRTRAGETPVRSTGYLVRLVPPWWLPKQASTCPTSTGAVTLSLTWPPASDSAI